MPTTPTSGAADLPKALRLAAPKVAPMSPINRLIAYGAATKLSELGFNWDEESESWMNTAAPTAQADTQPAPSPAPVGVTAEQRRLISVIADKIEDGSLFQAGIYSKKDLARFVRNVLAVTPQAAPQADTQPAPAPDERDDFEKVFPLPSGCIRVGTGYASTGYSNWAAHTHCERWQGWQARAARAPADSVQEDAARSERERICAAIKVEDDYCVEQGDYMLDSDDCIKIARGDWVRPDFSVDAARKQGATQ